jgi:hypothetical protein
LRKEIAIKEKTLSSLQLQRTPFEKDFRKHFAALEETAKIRETYRKQIQTLNGIGFHLRRRQKACRGTFLYRGLRTAEEYQALVEEDHALAARLLAKEKQALAEEALALAARKAEYQALAEEALALAARQAEEQQQLQQRRQAFQEKEGQLKRNWRGGVRCGWYVPVRRSITNSPLP